MHISIMHVHQIKTNIRILEVCHQICYIDNRKRESQRNDLPL